MSNTEKASSAEESTPQRIGYGSPPSEHRFKKGQSGNPKGRPKKKKRQKSNFVPDFGTKGSDNLLMEEAFNLISLKEDGKIIKLPAAQAVYRAMFLKAIKGDRFARQEVISMLQRKEDEDQQKLTANIDDIVAYKKHAQKVTQEANQMGVSPPEFIPHPDDWATNPKTGELEINGPTSEVERLKWETSFKKRDELAKSIEHFAKEYERGNDPEQKSFNLKFWHYYQEIFDQINDSYPKRYRAKLKYRSHFEGCSKEGEFELDQWPGD